MSALLEALGVVGNVLDTPGAFLRTSLAGRNPFPGVLDPSQRVGGRELLEGWGVLSPNTEGFDAGDVAGFGAEVLLDPLNLVGAGVATKLGLARHGAKVKNLAREQMLAKGAMPAEVAAQTMARDTAGNPARVYHGTPYVFDKFDMARANPEALYGPGIYTTESPTIGSEYAATMADELADRRATLGDDLKDHLAELAARRGEGQPSHWFTGQSEDVLQRRIEMLQEELAALPSPAPNVRMHYLDVRNPLNMDVPVASDSIARIQGQNPARYDAIKHTGGAITGGDPHQVWIALDPSQVYGPWVAPPAVTPPRVSPLLTAMGGYNVANQGLSPMR